MEQEKASIVEARNTLSALINKVAYGGVRVILESQGKPKAALVSIQDLEKLKRPEQEREEEVPTGTLALAGSLRERIYARRQEEMADSASLVDQLREGRMSDLSSGRRR